MFDYCSITITINPYTSLTYHPVEYYWLKIYYDKPKQNMNWTLLLLIYVLSKVI